MKLRIKKEKCKNSYRLLTLLVSLFLIPSSVFATEKVEYIVERFESYNLMLDVNFKDSVKNPKYSAGQNISADVSIRNIGSYCLLDGILVYDLVKGRETPVVNRLTDKEVVDGENIWQENTIPFVICPGEVKTISLGVQLPKDLSSGQYRLDVYTKSPKLSINGNHEAYIPGATLPFQVKGEGSFPEVKIVRSKTRFAGGPHQVGPVVDPIEGHSGYVSIQNDSDKKFEGVLKIKACVFGETSGLGCEATKSVDVSIEPNKEALVEFKLSTKIKPDVYSLSYNLLDQSGRLVSVYKNRFIVKGHRASLRYISADKATYKKGDKVEIQASINGPYTYGLSGGVTKDVDLRINFYDTRGLFNKKLFSKTESYPSISGDSEESFWETFNTDSDIASYKICGELLVSGKRVDYRCVKGGQDIVYTLRLWNALPISALILFITYLLFQIKKRLSNRNKIPLLIIFSAFIISGYIIFGFGDNASAYYFYKLIPGNGQSGVDKFTSPTVKAICGYVQFYNDKNGDDVPQITEQTKLFVGKDDGVFYIPKGTIAYLFRPLFDDPTVTGPFTYGGVTKQHTISPTSPYIGCVDTPIGVCANGTPVAVSYWPQYLMDVVKSKPGPEPTFKSVTTHSINITPQQILNAINANTYSNPILTTKAAITPALTTADVPDLATLLSGGDLSLLDSYIGQDQVTTPNPPHPYPSAQIFEKYKIRCGETNPQVNVGKSNIAQTTQLETSSPKAVFAGSFFSIFNFKNIDKTKLLAALPPSGCTVTTITPGTYNGQVLSNCAATNNVISGNLASYYRFSVNAGDLVIITMTSASYNGDTYLHLLDPTGLSKDFNDQCTFCSGIVTNNARIYRYIIPTTGDYYIEASFYKNLSPKAIAGTTFNLIVEKVAPLTPALSAITIGDGKLTVNWSASTGATGYYIYRTESLNDTGDLNFAISSVNLIKNIISGATVTYVDTPLTNGTTYYYKVSAYNNAGESLAQTTGVKAKPLAPPATPNAPIVTPLFGSLKIDWSAVPNASSYKLYRRTIDPSVTETDTLISLGNVLTYTNLSLSADTTFYYKLSATNITGTSALSPVNTGISQPKPLSPALSAITIGDGKLTVNWSASTGATGYYIYRTESLNDTGDLNFAISSVNLIKNIISGATVTYVDTPLTNGTTYYYKVSAYNNAGESLAQTTGVKAKPLAIPVAPGTPTIGVFSNTQVSLSWTAVPTATGYKVFRNTTNAAPVAGDEVTSTCPIGGDSATGGTLTTVGSDRVHTFTTTGVSTFTPNTALNVKVLVVSGGGGGGGVIAGGGGGGGVIYNSSFPVTSKAYSVTVGGGGIGGMGLNGGNSIGANGGSSIFDTIIPAGGGGGGTHDGTILTGKAIGANGGSGGGGAGTGGNSGGGAGGIGTPAGQGSNGGKGSGGYANADSGGGGGGANGVGADALSPVGLELNGGVGGNGGAGISTSISGTPTNYAGGGGGGRRESGGNSTGKAGNGTTGGGGRGGNGDSQLPIAYDGSVLTGASDPKLDASSASMDGRVNTGGGGGGGGYSGGSNLRRGGDGGSGIVIISYPLNSPTACTNTGLDAGTSYYYFVKASNSSGDSGPSSPGVQVTTSGTPPAPNAPTGVSTIGLDKKVSLSWTAPTTGPTPTGYFMYSSLNGTDYAKFNTSPIATISGTVTGLENGFSYTFKVSADNKGSEGPPSSPSVETTPIPPPSAPTGLTATPDDTKITLNWTAPSGTVTGYNVYRSTSSVAGAGLGTLITTTPITGTAVINTGLTNGTTYFYKVTAINNSGESAPPSSQVSAVPFVPCIVLGPDTTSSAMTTITVNGVTYYIDLDNVRGWIWNNSLITSTTKNTYTYPPGSSLAGDSILQYKFKQSGFYKLFIKEDKAARSSFFGAAGGGVPASPDSYNSQFKDRRIK